jgi:hypothetical protein
VIRRQATIVGLIGAALATACLDMSAPKGPASISELQLPSPSIVVGDVMRDSTGAPAMLSVIAYDADGNRISGVTPQFVITDSIKFAHFDASGVLTGDSLGLVHIIGQFGNLQTPVAPVPITVPPISVAATPIDTFRIQLTSDTTPGRTTVGVVMSGANGTFPQGFLVHFALLHAPPTKPGFAPAVFLSSSKNQNNPSNVDTTSASGSASLSLSVVVHHLSDSLTAGLLRDSAVVEMTATYKGAPIPGSPVDLVVPLVFSTPP